MKATSKTVAVIGASTARNKYGNKSVRAHRDAGYEVFPVNPRADEIEGMKCYPSVDEVPGQLNRITLYLPPQLGLQALESIAAKGCDELWLNPGTESDELIEKAKQLGINVVIGCSIVDLGVSPGDFPD